jgi:hypothetical protein
LYGDVTVAVGRIGDGVIDGLNSRYTTFTVLYIIGVSGLIFTFIDSANPKRKLIKYAVLIALAINIPLLFSSYSNGVQTSKQWNNQMVSIQYCTHHTIVSSVATFNCLVEATNGNVTNPQARLQFLQDKHWAGY